MLSRGISVMAAGQTIDCQWTPESRISFDDYEQIVRHKVSPLLGLPIAMVLAIADGSDEDVLQVLRVHRRLGLPQRLTTSGSSQISIRDSMATGY